MELRPYQSEAISALLKFWREKSTGTPLIVCPTGAGKTILVADICRKVLAKRPAYRILIVSHRAEIIKQNALAVEKYLGVRVGVFSAGLGIKRLAQVTCANIQSIFKKDLPETQLLLIDEAHLFSGRDDSMYGKLLGRLREKNRHIKVVGLTATPYRLDQGSLLGTLFTEICFDIGITRLIDEGFLSPLISAPSSSKLDFSDLKRSGYDYKTSDVEAKMLTKVQEQAREIASRIADRKHVLVFCAGVVQAQKTAEALREVGIESEAITGDMMPMQREQILRRFASGQIKALCNCEVLTTGYNFPAIDAVVLLRATLSCGLYCQMVGRGSRVVEGKSNCLVLDFGGNIKRHGPIDCIEVGAKKKGSKAEIKVAPTKECKSCGCIVAIRVLICPSCGQEFSVESTRLEIKPSEEQIISAPQRLEIMAFQFNIGRKGTNPTYFKLVLIATKNGKMYPVDIQEFFCFEHGGFATQKAQSKWILYGGMVPAPMSSLEAMMRKEELVIPSAVEIRKSGKYNQITKISGNLKINSDKALAS